MVGSMDSIIIRDSAKGKERKVLTQTCPLSAIGAVVGDTGYKYKLSW